MTERGFLLYTISMTFRNGDAVTLDDGLGTVRTGTLYLPDVHYSGPTVPAFTASQVVSGVLAEYTITLADGKRFRTKGRLTPNP